VKGEDEKKCEDLVKVTAKVMFLTKFCQLRGSQEPPRLHHDIVTEESSNHGEMQMVKG